MNHPPLLAPGPPLRLLTLSLWAPLQKSFGFSLLGSCSKALGNVDKMAYSIVHYGVVLLLQYNESPLESSHKRVSIPSVVRADVCVTIS